MAKRAVLVLVLGLLAAGCKKKQAPDTTASGSAPVASGSAGSGGAASHAKIVGEWNVVGVAGTCTANDLAPCPDKECDPPAPRAIECPAGIAETGNARVVELDDKSCAIAPADCKTAACLGAKTPCPLPKGEAFAPLQWSVTALADGTCFATSSSPQQGNKSITIKCPPGDLAGVTITRPKADAPCTVGAAGKTAEIPCPVEPKLLTIAKLREEVTAAANPYADQRVAVKGFYVKSMVSQAAQGKSTIYRLGVADPKGDAKLAITCEAAIPLPEAADGDAILVEGTPKKGTGPNELALTTCHASAP